MKDHTELCSDRHPWKFTHHTCVCVCVCEIAYSVLPAISSSYLLKLPFPLYLFPPDIPLYRSRALADSCKRSYMMYYQPILFNWQYVLFLCYAVIAAPNISRAEGGLLCAYEVYARFHERAAMSRQESHCWR